MDLVRDLLDKKVIDRDGREMGRVDGIVLEVREGDPPRVVGLELGPAVLANRLHPALGRWAAALEQGFAVARGRPLRIPYGAIIQIDLDVKVDLAFEETSASTVERKLRRWVDSIPGAS